MFVTCVYPVAVFNVAFGMTGSLLMLVEHVRGDHIVAPIFRGVVDIDPP